MSSGLLGSQRRIGPNLNHLFNNRTVMNAEAAKVLSHSYMINNYKLTTMIYKIIKPEVVP